MRPSQLNSDFQPHRPLSHHTEQPKSHLASFRVCWIPVLPSIKVSFTPSSHFSATHEASYPAFGSSYIHPKFPITGNQTSRSSIVNDIASSLRPRLPSLNMPISTPRPHSISPPYTTPNPRVHYYYYYYYYHHDSSKSLTTRQALKQPASPSELAFAQTGHTYETGIQLQSTDRRQDTSHPTPPKITPRVVSRSPS
ncbi:hypothetical protein BJX76DRAFT_76946 [Aspergillus varians]